MTVPVYHFSTTIRLKPNGQPLPWNSIKTRFRTFDVCTVNWRIGVDYKYFRFRIYPMINGDKFSPVFCFTRNTHRKYIVSLARCIRNSTATTLAWVQKFCTNKYRNNKYYFNIYLFPPLPTENVNSFFRTFTTKKIYCAFSYVVNNINFKFCRELNFLLKKDLYEPIFIRSSNTAVQIQFDWNVMCPVYFCAGLPQWMQ